MQAAVVAAYCFLIAHSASAQSPHSDSARSRVRASVGLGYGPALGAASVRGNGSQESMRDTVSSQALLDLAIEYRVEGAAFLGAYGYLGKAYLSSDGQLRGCGGAGRSCSSGDYALGVMARYHWALGSLWHVYAGGGVAYEVWTVFTVTPLGDDSAKMTGVEFPIHLGLDYAIVPRFEIGPELRLLLGVFSSSSGSVRTRENVIVLAHDINRPELHAWFVPGLSASYSF